MMATLRIDRPSFGQRRQEEGDFEALREYACEYARDYGLEVVTDTDAEFRADDGDDETPPRDLIVTVWK